MRGLAVNRSPYSLGCTAAGLPAGARAAKAGCGEFAAELQRFINNLN